MGLVGHKPRLLGLVAHKPHSDWPERPIGRHSGAVTSHRSLWGRSLGGEALAQAGQDRVGDQAADVAAVPGDFLDQAGAEERVQRVGGHEQRLDLGHPVVHLRHLHLVLEIGDGAQPLDDRGDPVGSAEVHQQAVEPVDLHVAVPGGDLAQHLHPLVDGEQALLGHVDQDRDDDLVVEPGGAADDVEVSVGDGVERAWTDDAMHEVWPFHSSGVPAARPYQKVASPYRRARSATYPAGQLSGPDRVARSTITSAPGASQARSASAVSIADTSSPLSAYGGSANTTSYPPPESSGPRASTRSVLSSTTCAPGRPSDATFSFMTRPARAPDSTSRTWPAPRDRASRPTAPEPAYRSRTRAPASGPTIEEMVANSPSLARSLVGLVSRPPGTASRRPPRQR